MEKRKISVLVFLIFGTLFMINFISATFCCERTIRDIDLNTPGDQGGMCQQVNDVSLCDSGFGKAPTSCDETSYCRKGTCVDITAGTCSPSRKAICENKTSSSFQLAGIDDIGLCKEGCCIRGDRVAFETETQCNSFARQTGVNVQFRGDLDAEACYALDLVNEKGACVREVNFVKECSVKTKEECTGGATFYAGLLCSAPGISQCQMPITNQVETACGEDGRVYFKDTCGNLANVYDQSKMQISDYWTNIQEPECTTEGANSTCGNCEYRLGTTCSEYKTGEDYDYAMPETDPSEYGKKLNYVCRELSCKYDGTIYAHGESWCYESPGTFFHIPAIINETVREETDIETGDYNLPGSEYYKLQCWDGEVIPQQCRPLREDICFESPIPISPDNYNSDGVYLTASCRINNWRGCSLIANESECEDPIRDCKWLHGYRFDGTEIKEFLGDESEIEAGKDEQGSCVPLFAPGYEFWSGETEGGAICASGSVSDAAVYETRWYTRRDKFEDASTKNAAQRCLENCYSIPDYGSGIELQDVINFYNGVYSLRGGNTQYFLSLRKGHYCAPVGKSAIEDEERALGIVAEGAPNCANNEDRIVKPLFYTNEQWLDFLKNRTHALGDCGYKENTAGEYGQAGGEIISAVFEKLNQQGEVKENGTSETIYAGNEWKFEEYRSN